MAEYQTIEQLADKATLLTAHDGHVFDDIPRGIWGGFGLAWIMLFSLFWMFFAHGTAAVFAITVSTLFGAMYFGLPLVMLRQTKPRSRLISGKIATCTGPVLVKSAAVQILLIPVALAFAIFAMGIIKLVVTGS